MRQQLGAAPSRTLDAADKTYVDTAVAASLQVANNLSDLGSAATARTNLGLGTAAVAAGPSGTIVGTTDTQTLTNKTLTSATLSSPAITSAGISLAGSSSGATTLTASPTASGSLTLPAVVDTLTGNAATQTLTNKTLTAPKIATIVNTGTLSLPTSTDTLVGRATTDTLTNKTINGSSNTITNVAVSALITTGSASSSTFLNGAGAWAVPGGITGTATPTANNVAEWDANTNLSADAFIPGFTSTATAGATTTLTVTSMAIQQFTGSTTQTCVLPSTSIVAGMGFFIANASTGAVTVQSSNTVTITVLAPNTSAFFTANVAAPNIPAGWDYYYYGLMVTGGKTPSITNSINLAGTDGTTMTFPATSDTVAGVAATQTLTNKTISGANNTLSNIALSQLASAAYSTSPTASTLAERDANANLISNNFITSATTTAASSTTLALTAASAAVQIITGTSTAQVVTLPSTGVVVGQQFTIVSELTAQYVTLESSNGTLICYLGYGTNASVTATALVAAPTTPAGWSVTPSISTLSSNTAAYFMPNGEGAAADYLVAAGSTQTLTNKTLSSPSIVSPTITNQIVTSYTETVQALGTVSTSRTLSLSSGTIITLTLAGGSVTFTMPTAAAGLSFMVMCKQPASGAGGPFGTPVFTGVKWNVAGTWSMTAANGTMDILTFFSDGTDWYGSYSQGYLY